jgi:hypothetical protein
VDVENDLGTTAIIWSTFTVMMLFLPQNLKFVGPISQWHPEAQGRA